MKLSKIKNAWLLLFSVAVLLAGGATAVRGQAPCGTFTNPTTIIINDSGVAAPYPSNIATSGLAGTVTKVTVTLNGLSHSFPADIDMLLVGPSGENAIIMSDAGGGNPGVTNATFTLDDAAAGSIPEPLVNGTFQPTNLGPGDPFPAPAPAPAGGSALSIFNGTNPNGTWSLYVVDDASGDTGTITGGWSVTITTTGCRPFANPTQIVINDGAPANPYPSVNTVSGLVGTVAKVTVTIKNLAHTFPNDIDMLLVGPNGENALIMSDVGGGNPGVTNVTLTFDDAATNPVPDPLVSGIFQPSNVAAGDTFPAPAPAPKGGSALSVFNGMNPNGTWSLYVVDDAGGDTGVIAGGWELVITTGAPTPTPTPVATPTPTPGGPTPTPNPFSNCGLGNIATRGVVQTADTALFGSFIITGTASKQVLIRANGPSLAAFGVPNVLADPTMELHDSTTALIMQNDNWKDTQEAEIIATGFPPQTDDREAAILITLPPGAYTAIIRGKNDTVGTAIVEVYGF